MATFHLCIECKQFKVTNEDDKLCNECREKLAWDAPLYPEDATQEEEEGLAA